MRLRLFCAAWSCLFAVAASCPADIFRFYDGTLIPGTEGITPDPGAQLDHRELEFAKLSQTNLTGANFESSNLTRALLTYAVLEHANLRNTNLAGAYLASAYLAQADLTGAIVTDSNLSYTTLNGLTKEQLYSTASYQAKDLRGMFLRDNRLIGWNFRDQDLTGTLFISSNLANANFTGANLTNASLESTLLTNARLTGANLTNARLSSARVSGADFRGAFINGTELSYLNGFTTQQLYSTASYQARNLRGVTIAGNRLTAAKFTDFDLSDTNFSEAKLDKADFTGALLSRARFDLADLTGAKMTNANLAHALLSGATLEDAILSNADITLADVSNTTSLGFTQQQLYSTANYQARDLRGIEFRDNDLTGWDFEGQDLRDASFHNAKLTNSDLSGAIIAGADLTGTTLRGLTKEQFYTTASYQAKDLRGIQFGEPGSSNQSNDLSDWNFSGQDLTGADLSFAILTNANLTGAEISNANFANTNEHGLQPEMLYSTASYQARDLRGINLGGFFSLWLGTASVRDLSGWDLGGQDLRDAGLFPTNLTNTNLSGADLRGAHVALLGDAAYSKAILALAITRNTILPDGQILDLDLAASQSLLVRDDDGDPKSNRRSIPIKIESHASLKYGSALQLLFEADPWDSLISFEPGIPVELGGMLELDFPDDVNVATQLGRTIRVFDWTGVSPTGTFTIRSPYRWDTSNLYTTGEVTLLAVPEPSTRILAVLIASWFLAQIRSIQWCAHRFVIASVLLSILDMMCESVLRRIPFCRPNSSLTSAFQPFYNSF